MDFNSIFNRQPSGSLDGRETPSNIYEEWEHFLTNIYPRGRDEDTVPMLKEQARRLKGRLRTIAIILNDPDTKDEPGLQQLYMNNRRATEVLLAEVEEFNRSGHIVTGPGLESVRESDAFSDLMHVDMVGDDKTINKLFSGIIDYAALKPSDRGPKSERLMQQTYAAAEHFKTAFDDRYKNLKRDTKAKLPPRARHLVDKIVDLFILGPIESLILVIRRNYPGPIGAFHGLEEEGCE
jgi:hypothetical protein